MGPPAPDRVCPCLCEDARNCFYQDKDGRLTDEGKRLQRQQGFCRMSSREVYIERHGIPHVADPLRGIYPDRDTKKYQL